MFVQVAPGNARPRDPENPIKNKAMVPRAASAASTALNHKRLQTRPFFVAHQTPDQGSLPKATLNQILPLLGIPFVNTSYVNMLSAEAQAAIGKVHDDGRAARNLLLEEGFRDEGYVDIFDAGPTMVATIDDLRAIRNLHHAMFARTDDGDTLRDHLITCGTGEEFVCTVGSIEAAGGQAMTDPVSAGVLGLTAGQPFSYLAL